MQYGEKSHHHGGSRTRLASREFHNFNCCFRDRPEYKVIAFTATQIPFIEGRTYPAILAGRLYPKGIPIYPEESLSKLIKKHAVDIVVLAYSDVPYSYVMHRASLVAACGANFALIGPKETMLKSKRPVISVCAVRTGCGKSTTTRYICKLLLEAGKRPIVVRHPMPYGDIKRQVCQRFASYADMTGCTIEEREEYEPLIDMGIVVYAGVDYKKVLAEAEKEADIIVWDGGNNDWPFFKPNLHIVLADALRPGHEISYWPSEVNVRMADVIIINKQSSARRENVEMIKMNIKRCNPYAVVIDADSDIFVSSPEMIKGKDVLVIEDGPTLTHGGMPYAAGFIAAKKYGADIIDPRPFAIGSIKAVYVTYPHLGPVLPAMGYSKRQIKELERTINRCECDAVISGTPIDLRRILKINKHVVRVRYELNESGKSKLKMILKERGFI